MTDDDTPPPPLAKADGSADMADEHKGEKGTGEEEALPEAKAVKLPAADEEEPPARPSGTDLHVEPTFPDDGPLAARLRTIDNVVGKIEQGLLLGLLALIVSVTALHALGDRLFHHRIEIKEELVRGGTYAVAMFGAAFASHQAKHLSMDLVSRRLSPRSRLILKVVLGLFVIFIITRVMSAALINVKTVTGEKTSFKYLTPVRVAWTIPMACVLIMFHTALHAVIDIDYLVRKKLPPERQRSAH